MAVGGHDLFDKDLLNGQGEGFLKLLSPLLMGIVLRQGFDLFIGLFPGFGRALDFLHEKAARLREIEHFCHHLLPEFVSRFADRAATADQAEDLDELRESVRLLTKERDDLRDQVARLESELALVS